MIGYGRFVGPIGLLAAVVKAVVGPAGVGSVADSLVILIGKGRWVGLWVGYVASC